MSAHTGALSFREEAFSTFEAAQNTNIDLVTFTELQHVFVDRWRIAMGEQLMPFADRLFPWDPSDGRMPRFQWTDAHRERQRRLIEAYEPLIHLGPGSRDRQFIRRLPVTLPAVNELGRFEGKIEIATYRQLYDFIEANKDTALYHFQFLHGELAQPHRWGVCAERLSRRSICASEVLGARHGDGYLARGR